MMELLRRRLVYRLVIGVAVFFPASSLAQSVAVTVPDSGALIQHSGGVADVAVSASASGLPTGGGVEIVLDLGTASQRSVKDLSAPYACVLTSVKLGEHTLDAFAVNSQGNRIAGPDHRERIGVGDILVAVGDSITAGEVDDITSDNWSADGRNGPRNGFGGYEPILNDLLTASGGYPHSIPNEGLPGETTNGAKTCIAEIIARNPTAKTWLIAYGTNDAASPMVADTFRANLQSMIAQIQTAIPGAAVLLPRVFYNDETRTGNYLIPGYDLVMDDLARTVPGVYRGADLDTLFRANHKRYDHRASQQGTWLGTGRTHHPNGIGVQKMAMLWKMALDDCAILVTDGAFDTLGDLGIDKIRAAGVTGIGLNGGNLLELCDQSKHGDPPPGTSFVGDWRIRLILSAADDFSRGHLDVTLAVTDYGIPPPGVPWTKVWLSRDDEILWTTQEVDADDSSLHYLTARVDGPGQIAPVIVPNIAPPKTTCSAVPARPNGRNDWYISTPRITLVSVNAFGRPAETILWRWDSGAETAYRSPLSAPLGRHCLRYHGVERGDNVENARTSVFKVDTTAPTKPVVTVSTRSVKRGVGITVSWSSRDPESGIDMYKYAIGTGAGRSNVQGWTSVGTQTAVTWKATGSVGTTYYFSVKARNRAGLYSETAVSLSVKVAP